MKNEILKLDVNENVIADAINQAVKGAIIGALGNADEIVSNAVNTVLGSYVESSSGKPCRKGDYCAMPLLDYIATQTIVEAVRDVAHETIKENKEAFKAVIVKELSNSNFQRCVAKNFVTTMLDKSASVYKMPITIKFEAEEYA